MGKGPTHVAAARVTLLNAVLHRGRTWVRQGSCKNCWCPGLGPRRSHGTGQGRQGAELHRVRGIVPGIRLRGTALYAVWSRSQDHCI